MESIGSGEDEKNSRKAVASNVADDTIIRNEGRFRHTLRTELVLEGSWAGMPDLLLQNGQKQVGVHAAFVCFINLKPIYQKSTEQWLNNGMRTMIILKRLKRGSNRASRKRTPSVM
jgi:hypothetical protein